MLQSKYKLKKGAATIEYAILIALVGVVVGMAFWNLSKDPEMFRTLFRSMWGNKTTQTTGANNVIKLELPSMDP